MLRRVGARLAPAMVVLLLVALPARAALFDDFTGTMGGSDFP